MLFIKKWQADALQAFSIFYFVSVSVIILFTYVNIVIIARTISSNKDSATKAHKTVLLHLIQLLLCLSSFLYGFIERAAAMVGNSKLISDLRYLNYLFVLVLPRTISSNKDSATKAHKTVLLHLIQLLLCLSSFLYSFIERAAAMVGNSKLILDLRYLNYLFVLVLPRCLSPLIYGLRDDASARYRRSDRNLQRALPAPQETSASRAVAAASFFAKITVAPCGKVPSRWNPSYRRLPEVRHAGHSSWKAKGYPVLRTATADQKLTPPPSSGKWITLDFSALSIYLPRVLLLPMQRGLEDDIVSASPSKLTSKCPPNLMYIL
ncbi:hypothetical protein KOW79_015888 [Hemibagrus wyckioides]|uniref:G-protein coupled receptors family 1 profile domain-containing protein n=1 Tax=Hemibagrus wyckioides TaxID=337641 RepID=A0A9D3NEL8_9TELE|nr:hypothetical protein KOW79_015888 [Hemibagrus wyckioides]